MDSQDNVVAQLSHNFHGVVSEVVELSSAHPLLWRYNLKVSPTTSYSYTLAGRVEETYMHMEMTLEINVKQYVHTGEFLEG